MIILQWLERKVLISADVLQGLVLTDLEIKSVEG